jgi:hypothetical protein
VMKDQVKGGGSRSDQGPPFLSWRKTRYLVLLFALIGVQIAFTSVPAVRVLMLRAGINPNWRFVVFALYAPLLVWLIRWVQRTDRTTKRRLATGELPCWECGYDLRATESPGLCPECGKAFESNELGSKWKWYLEMGTSKKRGA